MRVVAALALLLALCPGARTSEAAPAALCPPGRYAIDPGAGRLLGASDGTAVETIVVGAGRVSLSSGCASVAAKQRATRRGTKLKVRWPAGVCRGLSGPARLSARIDAACGQLDGVWRAKKVRRRVKAPRSDAPLDVAIVLDETRRTTATVTPAEGGTLTITAGDGTEVTLAIPPGAVSEPRTVTATLVAAIPGLPLSGGLAAAVHLEPEGLRLHEAATLTVAPATALDAERVRGFGYGGAGTSLHLHPADFDGASVTLPLLHFSGYGVGTGEEGDAAALATAAANAEDQAMQAIEMLETASPAETAPILKTWFDDAVRPGLEAAVDALDLLEEALGEYFTWTGVVTAFGTETLLASEIATGRALAIDVFEAAIASENAACLESGDPVGPVENVVALQNEALFAGLAPSGGSLSLPMVLDGLCLKAEILEITAPTTIGGVDGADLGVRAVAVLGGVQRFDLPVTVSFNFSPENASVVPDAGPTAADGWLTAHASLGGTSTALSMFVIAAYSPVPLVREVESVFIPGAIGVVLAGKLEGEPDSSLTDPVSTADGTEVDLVAVVLQGKGTKPGVEVVFSIAGPGELALPQTLSGAEGRAESGVDPGDACDASATVTATVLQDGEPVSDTMTIEYGPCTDVYAMLDRQTSNATAQPQCEDTVPDTRFMDTNQGAPFGMQQDSAARTSPDGSATATGSFDATAELGDGHRVTAMTAMVTATGGITAPSCPLEAQGYGTGSAYYAFSVHGGPMAYEVTMATPAATRTSPVAEKQVAHAFVQLADDAGGELYMKFASALGTTTDEGASSGILAPGNYELRAVANVRANRNLWTPGFHSESGDASASVTLTLVPASP